MRHLTSYLCEIFECSLTELTLKLCEKPLHSKKILESLPLFTSHDKPFTVIRCDSVSIDGPRNVLGCGGFLGITVEQLMYIKHDITLRYPNLPCLVTRHGDTGGETHYPIELALIDA